MEDEERDGWKEEGLRASVSPLISVMKSPEVTRTADAATKGAAVWLPSVVMGEWNGGQIQTLV